MFRRIAVTFAVSIIFTTAASAVEAPLPRHPAPSPDGSQIAFAWQGDLWLVPVAGGDARRLTAHPAIERYPVWSRDGRFLAFASNRHGNLDVFVMPVDGSAAPVRLTYASTSDVPDDFTPDGEAVLFTSNRRESVKWGSQLWTVPVDGGTPALTQDAFGEAASYSPGGEELAFVRGQTKWTRRGYRGSASRDIWLRDGGGDYSKLTDFDGTDDRPTWLDGDTIIFLSSRDGTQERLPPRRGVEDCDGAHRPRRLGRALPARRRQRQRRRLRVRGRHLDGAARGWSTDPSVDPGAGGSGQEPHRAPHLDRRRR